MVDSHETLFDDCIYATFITAKVAVFFGFAISASKVEMQRSRSERLGWIGAIGWPLGAMVALTRGAI